MSSLNKVLLIGNLTRDPVSRATTGGMSICEMGLAINRRYRTATGEDREETCFVDIDVFGKQAEQCTRYLRKGALAFVEGRLKLDQWEDRATKQKRSRLKVTAERVQFLDSRNRAEGAGGAPAESDAEPYPATPRPAGAAPARPYPAPRAPAQPVADASAQPATEPAENAMPPDEESVDDIPF